MKILDFGLARLERAARAGERSDGDGDERHRPRHGDGDGRLHVAGAGAGRGGGPPLGPLRARRRPLRDADGPPRVPPGHVGRDAERDPEGGAAGASRRTAKIPPALDRVVRHCLEKKPEDRFQSARDLAFELEGLTGSSVTARPAAAPAIRRGRRWLGGLLGLAGPRRALAGAFLAGRGSAPLEIPTFQPDHVPPRRRLVGPLHAGRQDRGLRRRLGRAPPRRSTRCARTLRSRGRWGSRRGRWLASRRRASWRCCCRRPALTRTSHTPLGRERWPASLSREGCHDRWPPTSSAGTGPPTASDWWPSAS